MTEPIMHAVEKPKLIPVAVPWYVCPATPYLRLTVGDDCPTEVTFLAFIFLEENCDSVIAAVKDITSNEELQLSGGIDPHDRIVRVTFELSGCARMYPSFSNVEVIEEAAYDWSGLKYFYQYKPEHDNWGEKEWVEFNRPQKEEWQQTGICPNPRMYEVENSPWLKELQAKGYYTRPDWLKELLREDGYDFPEAKHYIILGHDSYVEVIGSGWHWEYKDWH